MDKEIQGIPRLNFPSDHYFHYGRYPVEWWYFWGKLDNESFFHYAEFIYHLGKNKIQTIHYSLDGKFYDEINNWKEDIISFSGYALGKFTFTTPKFGMIFESDKKPVIHKTLP